MKKRNATVMKHVHVDAKKEKSAHVMEIADAMIIANVDVTIKNN